MASEETRKKIGDAQRGKLVSEDTRKKISEANKGQKRSPETRQKMREAQKKRYENPEERRKISESKTEEVRRKMSEARGKIACEIVKKHHETVKEDPEHLSSEFMQNLIGLTCERL